MSTIWTQVTRKAYVPVNTDDPEYIDSLSIAVIASRDARQWASQEMEVRVLRDDDEIARARWTARKPEQVNR